MIWRAGLILGVALVGAAVLMMQSPSPQPDAPRVTLGIPVPEAQPDTSCTDAQVWTGKTQGACLIQPRVCHDDAAGCDEAPRLWTNMRPTGAGASHL